MFKKLLVFIILLFWGSSSFAGESSGKVVHLMAHHGDIIMFDAGVHTNKPACSTANNHWAFSLKTDLGRAMYSMLLSAAAQKLTVNVKGLNTCDAWGDRETPLFMWVNY